MDIHPGNLLATGEGLRLIDWEYAADGDVALDIAALFRGNGWSAGQQQRFAALRAGLSRRRPAAGAGAPLAAVGGLSDAAVV